MNSTSGELKFLLKHSSIYGIGNILSRLVSFLMLPLYTRVLTPADYGVLELIDATMAMVGLTLALGVAQAISRFYYQSDEVDDRNVVVSTGFYLVIFGMIAALIISLPLAEKLSTLIFSGPEKGELFAIALYTLAAGMVIDFVQIYFRVRQQSIAYVAVALVNLIGSVSLNIYFLVILDYGIIGILYSSLITKLVIAIPLAIYLLFKTGIKFSSTMAKELLHYSVPLIPAQLANSIVNQADRFILNHFISLEAAGIYGLAQKIGSAIHMLTTAPFIQTFLPRRFEIVKQDNARNVFKEAFYLHMTALVAVWLVTCLLADGIMVIMTTPEYYVAATFLPLIGVSLILLAMKYHFGFGILYSKHTIYYTYIYLFVSVLHLSLNFLLIPMFSAWGALIASIFAQAVNSALFLYFGRKYYDVDYGILAVTKPFILASAIYVFAQFVVPKVDIWITILVNLLCFAAFLTLGFWLNIFDPRIKAKIGGIFKKT